MKIIKDTKAANIGNLQTLMYSQSADLSSMKKATRQYVSPSWEMPPQSREYLGTPEFPEQQGPENKPGLWEAFRGGLHHPSKSTDWWLANRERIQQQEERYKNKPQTKRPSWLSRLVRRKSGLKVPPEIRQLFESYRRY